MDPKDPNLGNSGERTTPDSPYLYEFKRIYDHISREYGNKSKNALDYGCGTGYGTLHLAGAFRSVLGIDVDEHTIEYCSSTYDQPNLSFEVFDPSRQPFPDESFDHIFSFQVFEHVPEEMAVAYLEHLWAMLRPNGLAVITTPKSENYHGGFSGHPYHTKEYSRDEFDEILTEAFPANSYTLDSIRDVPSTQIRLAIKRFGRDKWLFRAAASAVKVLVSALERRGAIPILEESLVSDRANTIGSHYVVVRKAELASTQCT